MSVRRSDYFLIVITGAMQAHVLLLLTLFLCIKRLV